MDRKPKAAEEKSEFLDALKKGALLGALILVIVIPPLRMAQAPKPAAPPTVAQVQPAPQQRQAPVPAPVLPAPELPAAPEMPAPQQPRLADFGDQNPSPDVRHVANWATYTNNAKGKSFVVIDKKFAKVYVFSPQGKLVESTPALLGSAVGDDSAPGIGDKPLSQIKAHERTTPAGRFVAEPGVNLSGEDIVWIDYDAAVSMHRIRKVKASERRFERMATATHKDNRISNGCVNLPVQFYEKVLSPTVKKTGAVIYVLPETRTPQEVFGSFDVMQALSNQASRSPAAPTAAKVPAAGALPAATAPAAKATPQV
jgi:hypothetical protein